MMALYVLSPSLKCVTTPARLANWTFWWPYQGQLEVARAKKHVCFASLAFALSICVKFSYARSTYMPIWMKTNPVWCFLLCRPDATGSLDPGRWYVPLPPPAIRSQRVQLQRHYLAAMCGHDLTMEHHGPATGLVTKKTTFSPPHSWYENVDWSGLKINDPFC